MKRIKLVLMLALGGLVSACADTNTASRNAPFEAILPFASELQVLEVPSNALREPITDAMVESIMVRVPQSLSVSEANPYLPESDIVWRHDAIGDRHGYVQAIFETAMERGIVPMDGIAPLALRSRSK